MKQTFLHTSHTHAHTHTHTHTHRHTHKGEYYIVVVYQPHPCVTIITFHIQPQIVSFHLCSIGISLTYSVRIFCGVTFPANQKLVYVTWTDI